ncbi:hypothetical protein B0I35DRAFT_359973 [Stachybotrys elegans]|uniref:Uncharacterized protein n=1 Tax=Stachybotrys elegans TaxID=80388 RepID=A0A8K0SDK3_9HYPO|nr:hypothetical protein B0I35DRAFT_359973 [Stachybotrys elegans]
MTKVPSEAFLPSGAVDLEMSVSRIPHHSSSIPRTNGNAPAFYEPFSLDAVSAPTAGCMYDHGFPTTTSTLLSRSSLSPTSQPLAPANYTSTRPHASSFDATSAVPRSVGWSSAAAGHTHTLSPPIARGLEAPSQNLSRSVSADAAAAPQQSSYHLVQRLAQQNSLIREAWEAERNYLEANRRRAEEVYQEERAIMEDVRDSWETEKASLLAEIQGLKERVHRLEGENSTLRAVATQSVQMAGVVSPLQAQRGAAASALDADASLLPLGLDGASRRPHFASPGSSRMSPTGQPDGSSPFVPLEPRTQPENSSPHDFLSSSSEAVDTPVAIIDVQEIDPKLEGIPIKATAVQKSTFSQPSESPLTSPPIDANAANAGIPNPSTAAGAETSRPMPFKRLSSKEQTLQVLAAEESRRLTMHAGHTPNHSLSLFPTMSATDVVGSEGATPTTTEPVMQPAIRGDARPHRFAEESRDDTPEHPSITDPNAPLPLGAEVDPEPRLDPTDDVELKGPLMVKNIPAQDEIFWAQVNKKLEPISQGHDALPTVMRSCLDLAEESGGPSKVADQASDPKTTEGDVPLKFKSTNNFGAPFGST